MLSNTMWLILCHLLFHSLFIVFTSVTAQYTGGNIGAVLLLTDTCVAAVLASGFTPFS
jgi:hypothetical protein